MLRVELGDTGCYERFTIMPNRSLSWLASLGAFAAISGVTLGIAAVCAALGLWLVLPFAGFEVLVLAIGFYETAWRVPLREVIEIRADVIEVLKGRRNPGMRWSFPRAWTQVQLEPPTSVWYPSRLMLASHGRRLCLGACLSEDERSQLAGALRHHVGTGFKR